MTLDCLLKVSSCNHLPASRTHGSIHVRFFKILSRLSLRGTSQLERRVSPLLRGEADSAFSSRWFANA